MAEPGANGGDGKATVAKLSTQLKRLTEANTKYKNLLKLAKDRIQAQDDEVATLQQDKITLTERLAAEEKEDSKSGEIDEAVDEQAGDQEISTVRVFQRVKNRVGELEETWALLEMAVIGDDGLQKRLYTEWKRFDTEAGLEDFVRRDTGEPIVLPAYSLSAEQSELIQKGADMQVSKVAEDFRRFRVKAELARKQADAHIKDLQNSNARKAAQRIESSDAPLNHDHTRSGHVERLKAELVAQEAHWKESYDALLAENNALKSSGSEALLASQWRQRYEQCTKEKEEVASQLKMLAASGNGEQDKFEAKYRDLKESFRLYRKKAKEIFEAQQQGDGGGISSAAALSITANSSTDAKLSYLKNLMINYLTSDATKRDQMEMAISTVLQFSEQEKKTIAAKKASDEAWF